MIFRIISSAIVIVMCANIELSARSIGGCKTGYIEWEDRPLSEIVRQSHTVYLATVIRFVGDNSKEGFDGYYLLSSTGTELKGGAQRERRIYGADPYPYPAQFYFDIDRRHDEIDIRSVSGGSTAYTRQSAHCTLVPRFVIGYRYLIMLGTDSAMSFEPINAPQRDKWLKAVAEEVMSERKR